MLFISASTFAQDKSEKYKSVDIKVSGVCGMCEERIENALDIKGIRIAKCDIDTGICKVTYNTTKISEDDIHKTIAAAGHDTDKVKATQESYNNLHGCCKYREDVKH